MNITLLSALEVIATILGIIYLYLEYKAKYALWIVGIIWSVCYVFMFWKQGMIAWMITWGYYFFANIYGLFAWKNDKNVKETPTHISTSWIFPIILITTLLMYPLWLLEVKYNPLAHLNWVILGTVFSTAIGFVGMVLLAKKIVEQWFVWIIVNFIYTIINFYTGFYAKEPTHFLTASFFLGYTIMSIFGYLNWKRMAKSEKIIKSIS